MERNSSPTSSTGSPECQCGLSSRVAYASWCSDSATARFWWLRARVKSSWRRRISAYPFSMPDVGDYLTVADAVPTPDPGDGYSYVTAVTFQGETRYGRQAMGGVLSGRDPGLLPACVE